MSVIIDLTQKMPQPARAAQPKPEDLAEERARTRMQVAAMIVTAGLIVSGWVLVQAIARTTAIEDCLLSGRTNCLTIDVSALTAR